MMVVQFMTEPESPLFRAALICATGSVVAVLFSIAVSQILLGFALVTLVASRTRLRLPPVWLPLALFLAGTVLSLALSGRPADGLPQVRKIYVYFMLLVVFSTVRLVSRARALVLACAAVGSLGAVAGAIQFLHKAHAAHKAGVSFYDYYVGQRITGFLSHWQTFGSEQMIVLLMIAAFLMFSPHARGRALWLGLAAAALLGVALVLDFTRGTWLAAACGGLYLIWCWKRRLLLAVPVLVALLLWANPGSIRTRAESSFEPGRSDSNQFRIVCWRTGLRMIEAHPWFGLGPEVVRLDFMNWVPADIPRPLPSGWYGHLHNVYLHYAAERGIPTMLALVAALLMMLYHFRRALQRLEPGPSDRRFLLHGAFAVVIAAMVGGIFELNLGDSEVLALFLSVVAVGYVAREEPGAVPSCPIMK
jgi:putative inorganic carbon (HCO3(-)) transporter